MYRSSTMHILRNALRLPGSYLAAALSGAYTVTDFHPQRMALDPGGASRNVTLPTELEGRYFEFKNTADAAENLVLKDPAGNTVATLGQSQATRVEVVDGVWTQTFSVYASSPGSAAYDVVAESTPAAGVTVDGLRIKDAAVTPAAGASAWCDLSNCATGEADTIVGGNLANAWSIRTSALDYLVVRSTTATPGIDETFTHTGASSSHTLVSRINHATNAHVALDVQGVQLTTARTGGSVRGVSSKCTSLAGDLNSVVYSDFYAGAPTDGGGAVVHSAFTVAAGHDRAMDLTACATGEGVIALADNLAVAWALKEGSNSYLAACTTDGSEALASGKRLTTTDGVTSGTARIVGGLAYTSVAASTALTGTQEADTAFDSSYTLPANSLKAGTVLRIRAQGIHTATTGAETHTMALKVGSVTIASKTLIDPANNDIFYFDATVVCRDAGASGHIVATGTQAHGVPGTASAIPFLLASSVIDTTGTNVVGVYIDRQASATDSDSARLDVITVEVIG